MRRRMTSRFPSAFRDRSLIVWIPSARRASALDSPHSDSSYLPIEHKNNHLLRVSVARGRHAAGFFRSWRKEVISGTRLDMRLDVF